ncbi:MAG: N-acetylmuramoyl-L-alanine amidase [Nitrospirota bacterium]
MRSLLIANIILLSCLLQVQQETCLGAEILPKKFGIKAKIIYLDPWYDEKEKGPLFGQKYGKDITLEIAQRIKNFLEMDGFKVFLSRTGDQWVSLDKRLFQAKSQGADMHVSIKVSKAKKDCIKILLPRLFIKEVEFPSTKKIEDLGAEVNEMLDSLEAASINVESIFLGKTISERMSKTVFSKNIELRRGTNFILKNAQVPTVMVDFQLSSRNNHMFDSASLEQIVQQLADAIKEYSEGRNSKQITNENKNVLP